MNCGGTSSGCGSAGASPSQITMATPVWQTEFGDGPLVACAIHDGHATRPEVTLLLRLDSYGPPLRRGPLHRRLDDDRPDADRRATFALRSRPQSAARESRLPDARRRLGTRRVEVAPAGRRGESLPRRVRRFLRPPAVAAGTARRAPRPRRRLRSAQLQSRPPGGRRPGRERPGKPGDQPGHRHDGPPSIGAGSSIGGWPKCGGTTILAATWTCGKM